MSILMPDTDRNMLQEEFDEIVEQHHKWLSNTTPDGKRAVFRDVSLRNIVFAPGTNLTDSAFLSCDLSEITITDVNFSRSEFDNVSFYCSKLSNVNFADSTLDWCDFTESTLENVELNADKMYMVSFEATVLQKQFNMSFGDSNSGVRNAVREAVHDISCPIYCQQRMHDTVHLNIKFTPDWSNND